MLAWIWRPHFCAKIYFILAFVQNLNHFDCQLLETLEWRLFLTFSAHLQVSIQPFTWARVAGPTSYLSENFELPKCWTSEVPHPSYEISNCSTIQIVDIFFSLAREPTCPPYLLNLFFDIFKSFPLFTMIEFWVLALHSFYNVFADWYFAWLYLNFHWLSFRGLFNRCIFSLT